MNRYTAVLLSTLLLGACGTVPLPRIDCREQPPADEPQCPDGLTCKPDPRFIALWTCQPPSPTPPPTTQPPPPASPSPSPVPTPPEPSPSPSPVASPTPPAPPASPAPCTTTTVQPSRERLERLNGVWLAYTPPQIVKDKSAGRPYERMYRVLDGGVRDDCSTPSEKIQWARRTTNWVCPDNYPGNPSSCTINGEPAPCPTYDPVYGNGFCYSTGEGRQHTDRLSNHVDRHGNILHLADLDGYTGITCPVAMPPTVVTTCPSPSPTPPPPGPVPSPTPPVVVGTNFPAPPDGQCNAVYAGQVSRVGVNVLTARDCGEKCKRDGYLGYVLNFSATPKSKPPYCGHAPDRLECEQYKPCQDGINDLENADAGPGIFLTMPGKFTNDVCDKRSDNTFNCHHKPKASETGLLTVTACPRGVRPGDPRCSSRTFDVQADGAREVVR